MKVIAEIQSTIGNVDENPVVDMQWYSGDSGTAAMVAVGQCIEAAQSDFEFTRHVGIRIEF